MAGFTDNLGDPDYNMDLSRRRADSVRTFLLDHGMDANHIVAVGYGHNRAITDNSSVAKRYINRRVELSIIGYALDGN